MRIIPVIAVLLLLCGVGFCAESPTTQNYKKTETAQQKTAPIHSNAKEPPTIGDSTTLSLEKKTEDNKAHWYDELDKNRFLLFIGLLQLGVFGLQARRLRQTIEVTEKSADAAQKSADVAEKALTLLERPYVFAFGVSQFHLSTDRMDASLAYEVANFGKTPAIIERVQIAIENIKSNLDSVLEVDRWHGLVSAPILGAGEVRKGLTEDPPANMLIFNNITPDLKHGDDLFFRIIITYRGTFTKGHESSFCWRYSRHASCFEPYGHEKYNYTR
jgi:hypothetical protein